MASLYKRGEVYYAKGEDAEGRIWRESTRCKDRQAAKRIAKRIERRRAAEADQAPRLRLEDALAAVLAADHRAAASDATLEIHTTKGRHLMRLLGPDYDVASAAAEDLRAYADQRLAEPVGGTEDAPKLTSRHTVQKELGVLRLAIRTAGLTWDPRLMPDLGRHVYRPRERWLTVEEYRRLYAALPAHRRDYLTAWVYTGLDEGVLYRLTPEHVDLTREQVYAPDTKAEARARWIPLHPEALEVFRRRARRTGAGEPLFPEWPNCWRDLRAACKRAKIPPASAKDLRRTFCSWMAQAGVHMKACADLMGHSSLRMVEHVYARLGVDVHRQAVAALPTVRRGVPSCVSDTREFRDAGDTGDEP